MVTDPVTTSSLPRLPDVPLAATIAPQNTGTEAGHNGILHSVTVSDGTTIGTGTTQPTSGDAVIELSRLHADFLANEEQTENIWAEARNTFGYFNAVRAQRESIHAAAASGFVDTYDLFLPNGFGGIVKRVFLTDVDTTTSRTGIHALTGTRWSADTGTSFGLVLGQTTAQLRNDIPVLEIDNGARQFIFQQALNDPTAVTTGVLDTRGVTRQNLVNIGLNAPIIQADGTGLDTSFSTTDGG